MSAKGYIFKPGYGGIVYQHLNTGVILEGFTVPFAKEAVQMALALHEYFYGIHSVGWDIAITENGPVFIEGNDWEISMHQCYEGGMKKSYFTDLPFHEYIYA